jgi:hypothetical protein
MERSLQESLRDQPLSVMGLTMIDECEDHFRVCLDYCVRIRSQSHDGGHLIVLRSGQVETLAISPAYQFEKASWNSIADSVGLAKKLSDLRRAHEWAIIMLGFIDSPWVESVGRLCDKVYLSIPSGTDQGFNVVRKRLLKLQHAGVRIAGSYVSRSAA